MEQGSGMPSTIRCATCGFDNTTTSLYCQDCGARLVAPPSAVVEETAPANSAPAPTVKSKPRILSAHRPNPALKVLAVAARVLVVVALGALVALVLLPPAGLPAASPALSPEIVENVRAALRRSAQADKPFVAPWDGQGLNAYLAGVLLPRESSGFSFAGARLAPAGDGFTLFVERKLLGLSIYHATTYRLITRGSGLGLALIGSSLGRLPLPAAAAPMVEPLDASATKALAAELQILREAKTVQITPEKAFVNFGAPPP